MNLTTIGTPDYLLCNILEKVDTTDLLNILIELEVKIESLKLKALNQCFDAERKLDFSDADEYRQSYRYLCNDLMFIQRIKENVMER